MTMDEFLFYKTGGRRDRDESLHDLLITAKNGLKKTRILYGANLTWSTMIELLKFAKAEGLIEEVEVPRYEQYGIKKPAFVWRTTEKGLKYAQNIYDNSLLLEEVEGK